MVLHQEDSQWKANVHCTTDYFKQSLRTLLGRGWKVYLCSFDSQNSVLHRAATASKNTIIEEAKSVRYISYCLSVLESSKNNC